MERERKPTLSSDGRQIKRKFDDEDVKPDVKPLSKRPFLEQLPTTSHHDAEPLAFKSSSSGSIGDWLNEFKAMSMHNQLDALNSLVSICHPSHVRHLQGVVEPYFHKDFIGLLPKELSLSILRMLPVKDLARASEICKPWKVVTEDEHLWKTRCKELGIHELPPPNLTRSIYWEHTVWSVGPPEASFFPSTSLPYSSAITPKWSPSSADPKTCYERCRWKAIYMRQQKILSNWRNSQPAAKVQLRSHDDHVITCLQMRGNIVATGSDDNTVSIWTLDTADCRLTLRGHTGGVWTLQLSDDGEYIISGSTDRTLRVWSTQNGQLLHILSGHTSTVRCTAVHEQLVVSGSRDCTIRLWDFYQGALLRVFRGHRAAIRCVKFDGRRIVSGGYDHLLIIWDAFAGQPVHVLDGHTNRVYSLLFDSARNLVISGSLDTKIRVWDAETGKCLQTLEGHQSLTSGMHLLDDNRLISCNADSSIKIWDITTGQCIHTLSGKHASAVTSLQYIGHGLLTTSSDDGTVKLWDIDKATFVSDLVRLNSAGSGGCVWRLKANGTTLVCAVGSRNGTEDTKLFLFDFDAAYP